VVGEKVYLPNIIFRLVPNFTPPGKAYNPYEATFRIPQSVTKTDVRAYLAAMYGVQTTYIRTDNYFAPVRRALNGAWVRAGRSYRTYKRAVVGLVEPFYYPMVPEDMSKADREAREESLDQLYHIRARKDLLKAQLLRFTRKNSPGWVWSRGLDDAAGHDTEKDCGAAGVERTIQSSYEGAYAGGTGAIELSFLTLLIRCKQSQPVSVRFTAQELSLYVVVLSLTPKSALH